MWVIFLFLPEILELIFGLMFGYALISNLGIILTVIMLIIVGGIAIALYFWLNESYPVASITAPICLIFIAFIFKYNVSADFMQSITYHEVYSVSYPIEAEFKEYRLGGLISSNCKMSLSSNEYVAKDGSKYVLCNVIVEGDDYDDMIQAALSDISALKFEGYCSEKNIEEHEITPVTIDQVYSNIDKRNFFMIACYVVPLIIVLISFCKDKFM